jgi:hypothetical protein
MARTPARRIGITKIVGLLLLGIACTASSIALLLSLCVAMPVVTEQFAGWVKSAQWNAVPISAALARMGYAPHFEGALAPIGWLLSCETGCVIVVAAGVFAYAVRAFENAHKVSTTAFPVARQVKNSQPTIANTGTSTSTERAVKAKKLGIEMPRSTAMA